ncbi:hypothetical protein [Mucilaginibacter agri]|uniref:Uncharacterized protein n=1 Tax=Mucilaginibacter agri TaxID=2695265 RepID=A0A965ZCP3_9SPHI|nr:hypothetical protein [Mucilaginibacter agri]NCD68300.1 hypothetical protein [Mucilaginibacter agri]
MKNQELNGAFVLVDPRLENDPARGQGRLAMVNYESLDNKVYVSLETGREAVYDREELLKLKPKEDIIAALSDIDPKVSERDYLELYKITLLQDRGTLKSSGQALQIVQERPQLLDLATQPAFTVEQALEKSQAR